jgi:hypothetical protein
MPLKGIMICGRPKMPELTFKTDDEWRIAIAAQVIKLELAVYEVGIALMLVAAGAFVGSYWWHYGLIAGAAFGFGLLLNGYRNELKDFRRLINQARSK